MSVLTGKSTHSPLQFALGQASTSIARLLIHNGADLEHTDVAGQTIPASCFIYNSPNKWDPLKRRATHEMIQLLLGFEAIGAPIVEDDRPSDISLLSRAILVGDCSSDTIQLLLSTGAQALSNEYGASAFLMAVLRGRSDLLPILIEHKTTDDTWLGQAHAAMAGNEALLRHCISKCPHIYRELFLLRGLGAAVRLGNPLCTRVFIQAGADVDARHPVRHRKNLVAVHLDNICNHKNVIQLKTVQALIYDWVYNLQNNNSSDMTESENIARIATDFSAVLLELLRNGADPRPPRYLGTAQKCCLWSSTIGVMRPEELLGSWPTCLDTYCELIHEFFPETIVREGDIYWDANGITGGQEGSYVS